jgi:hypothetical protein
VGFGWRCSKGLYAGGRHRHGATVSALPLLCSSAPSAEARRHLIRYLHRMSRKPGNGAGGKAGRSRAPAKEQAVAHAGCGEPSTRRTLREFDTFSPLTAGARSDPDRGSPNKTAGRVADMSQQSTYVSNSG